MTLPEEENQPLFLDSQHLLVAVVATIAAQHGVEKTRELIDELAENDATWAAIAQKVEGVQPEHDAGAGVVDCEYDGENPPAPPPGEPLPEISESNGNVVDAGDVAGALLGGDGIESAGPDGVEAAPRVRDTEPPPPPEPEAEPAPLYDPVAPPIENGAAARKRAKKAANP